jgi:hypothetical protein
MLAADVYADHVVRELMAMRMSRPNAVRLVQSEERYVRRQHQASVAPAFVAARLSGKVKRQRGKEVVGLASGRRQPRRGEGLMVEAMIPAAPGHAVSLPVIPNTALDCTTETWQPALWIPADQYVDPNMVEPNVEPVDDEEDGYASGDVVYSAVEQREGPRGKFMMSTGEVPSLLQIAKSVKKNPAEGNRAIDRLAEILSQRSPDGGLVVVPTKKKRVANGSSWLSGGAYMIERSGNVKLRKELSTVMSRVGTKMEERPRRGTGHRTATTYTSIAGSCPTSCVLMGSGGGRFVASDTACYALLHQNIGPLIAILNGIVDRLRLTPVDVAQDEANVIDASFRLKNAFKNPTDLRIHTAGDSTTRKGTRLIAAAVARWQQRGGGQAWGYTHAWQSVERADWGPVSTLASVQNAAEARNAAERGWFPTIVVKAHTFKRLADLRQGRHLAFKLQGSDITWIPCPAQNPDKDKQIACVNCRMCMNDQQYIGRNVGIAFEAHGSGSKRAITYENGHQVVKMLNARAGRVETHLTVLQPMGRKPKSGGDDTPKGFAD